MNNFQIYEIFKKLIEETYPNKRIPHFFVELVDKNLKSKHGHYESKKRKILIFNLGRSFPFVLATTTHEVAHHVENMLEGDTGHSKIFYKYLKELHEKAIELGYYTYDDIKDKWDVTKMVKHHGVIDVKYASTNDNYENKRIIKVFNSFSYKDLLKKRNYQYNKLEKCWSKEALINNLQEEINFLKIHSKQVDVQLTKLADVVVTIPIYFKVTGSSKAFELKDKLTECGYKWKGYNVKGKYWVKKQVIDKKNELNIIKEETNKIAPLTLIVFKKK